MLCLGLAMGYPMLGHADKRAFDMAAHHPLARDAAERHLAHGWGAGHHSGGNQAWRHFPYKFVAKPSGTMWYHCHVNVNVNEHAAMRGMWGPFIVDLESPSPSETKVTKAYIMM